MAVETTSEDALGVHPGVGPLTGLLVADLSRVLAGPYATQIMADLGATVVKVEAPAGDETRGWRPPERDGVSTYYLGINRNKRDVVLDFKDEDDRADAARAVPPRGRRRRELPARRTACASASTTTASPPRTPASCTRRSAASAPAEGARLPGYDLIVQAASGLMSLTGDPDGPAYRSGVSVFDVMSGLQSVIGVLAALRHRDATGQGQHVEVNLLSTALAAMANHSSTYVAAGSVPFRMGNAHPSLFPYEPLPCSDGELVVVAANDPQFRKLAAALGRRGAGRRPPLRRHRTSATATARRCGRCCSRCLATDTVEGWFERLTAAGVPCGPINTIDGGVALAERLGLDPVVQVGEGDAAVPMIRNALRFSRDPRPVLAPRRRALGADSDAVRAWLRNGSRPGARRKDA